MDNIGTASVLFKHATPAHCEDRQMGKNQHAEDRVKTDHSTPPAGHDRITDDSHALRAGKGGPSQRKAALEPDQASRDAGSDDRRSGSESGKH